MTSSVVPRSRSLGRWLNPSRHSAMNGYERLMRFVLADRFIREFSDETMASRAPQLRSAQPALQASIWPVFRAC
jgi:hypothetical protein